MRLTTFKLKDFRNFHDVSLAFDPHVNIFIGRNAQGKTNLLEAIYFLALTRSQRTSSDKELVRFGAPFANLEGHVQKSQIDVSLKLRVTPKGKKAWVNALEQPKLSKYVGQLNAVSFSPEDLSLVKGSPSIRRRFMDLEFGQIDPNYLYFSNQYRQVLRQKNHYLKQLGLHQASDRMFLGVLSDQLAGLAAEIVVRRFKYLKQLDLAARCAQKAISATQEKLELQYLPSVRGVTETDTVEQVYQRLRATFAKEESNEIRLGTTLVGPHRDDLSFLIDGQDARLYASQGQQRTAVLSLKLAQIDLVHNLTKEYPILLLDDVMSELDHHRQSALLNFIHGRTQTFMTTTDLNGISWEIVKTPKIYQLVSGRINEKEGEEDG